jgi:hypothetical protein
MNWELFREELGELLTVLGVWAVFVLFFVVLGVC